MKDDLSFKISDSENKLRILKEISIKPTYVRINMCYSCIPVLKEKEFDDSPRVNFRYDENDIDNYLDFCSENNIVPLSNLNCNLIMEKHTDPGRYTGRKIWDMQSIAPNITIDKKLGDESAQNKIIDMVASGFLGGNKFSKIKITTSDYEYLNNYENAMNNGEYGSRVIPMLDEIIKNNYEIYSAEMLYRPNCMVNTNHLDSWIRIKTTRGVEISNVGVVGAGYGINPDDVGINPESLDKVTKFFRKIESEETGQQRIDEN